MANDRFAAWVTQTKEIAECVDTPSSDRFYHYIIKALVWALLTIAIAIHEAAETKRGK